MKKFRVRFREYLKDSVKDRTMVVAAGTLEAAYTKFWRKVAGATVNVLGWESL